MWGGVGNTEKRQKQFISDLNTRQIIHIGEKNCED